MRSMRLSIVLPALVLILFLGFGTTAALANAATAGPGDWSTGPIGSAKTSPGDPNGVTSNLAPGATLQVTGAGPVISDVVVKDIAQTSGEITWQATITWQTDELSDSKVQYSVDFDALNPEIFTNYVDTPVTVHAVALVGLLSDTKYYFMATSANRGGTTVDETIYSFKTKGEDKPEGSSKAFVGIWTEGVDPVTGADVNLLDPATGSGVTFIQQGNGRRVDDLPMPTTTLSSDGFSIDAAGPDGEPIDIKWPGRGKDLPTDTSDALDALVGKRVVAKAEWVDGDAGHWKVTSVIVKPDKLSRDQRPTRGAVKSFDPVENELTIELPNGKTKTVACGDNPCNNLQPGDGLTAFPKGWVSDKDVGKRLEKSRAAIDEKLGNAFGKERSALVSASKRFEGRHARFQDKLNDIKAKFDEKGRDFPGKKPDSKSSADGQAPSADGDETPGGPPAGRGTPSTPHRPGAGG